MIENSRTMRRVCWCSGVTGLLISPSDLPMRPISLDAPVAMTSAMPWPATTIEPAKTQPISVVALTCLGIGSDSPLSSDSSVSRSLASISLASAATRSPSVNSSKSPQTTSSPAMR